MYMSKSFYMKGICKVMENVMCRATDEISMPKGTLLLVTVIAFLIGFFVGLSCFHAKNRTMFKCKCGKNKDFDADEYVRSLNFDE